MKKAGRSLAQVRTIYVATTIFLAALSIYTFTHIINLLDAYKWVNHTHEVNESLQKISIHIVEAETNKRGFLLTGDSLLLPKRDTALNHLTEEQHLLYRLLIDSPEQLQSLHNLKAALTQRIVNLKNVSGGVPASAINDTLKANIAEGVQSMDRVRQSIDKMTLAENHLRSLRTERYTRQLLIAPLFIILLFLGALLILYVSYVRLNKAIYQSEQLQKELQLLVMEAPASICLLRGPQHLVKLANDRYLNILGQQNIYGQPLREVFPAMKDTGFYEILDEVYKTGKPLISHEVPVKLAKVGNRVKNAFFNFEYKASRDLNGAIEGVLIYGVDVTEQVLNRKKIEESEEKLNVVIDASELGTWELNLKTHAVNYSGRYLEILGYNDPVDLTHAQILEHLHPDDLPIREDAFKQSFVTGILHYESRLIWKDQSIHWIEGKGKVFYDAQKQPFKLLGTLRDITEEKNYQQILEESEQKFRLLANSMPQHVWTADPAGHLNYFNQSVFDYSGLTREQIGEKGWLEIVHPDERAENIKIWMHSIATGSDFLFEHRFRRHDGAYRWQLSRAIPQRDATGKIQMWVGTSTDIQEQKVFTDQLEKEVAERTRLLAQQNEELESINKELELFAHISSHDLQEPLRKIQMSISRIAEQDLDALTEKGREQFKRVEEATDTMQTLIEDLLSYSRTNSKQGKFENTDLNALMIEVIEGLREHIEEKNATIETIDLCEVNVVPFEFRQLLHNLLSNSIKFSKPGIPPHIVVQCKILKGSELIHERPTLSAGKILPEKSYHHIIVSDNGIGFEQEYSEKIFEVFQRLHGKQEYKGTGIGLAIVKKIVENHNGIIIASGELNKGSVFEIFIPSI